MKIEIERPYGNNCTGCPMSLLLNLGGWLKKAYNPLNKLVGRIDMPAFIEQRWLDYGIIPLPEDKPRNRTRRISRHFIPPYFNGSPIYFDLIFKQLGRVIEETINYEWELLDKDGNPLKTRLNSIQISGKKNRQRQAIEIGYLPIGNGYKVRAKFTNGSNVSSEYMDIAEFGIKDRDDLNLYLFYALLGAIITVLAGVIGAVITLLFTVWT